MSQVPDDTREGLFDAYVDGLLSDSAHREFERRLERDVNLRDELALQGQLNEHLRTLFAPPDAERIVARFPIRSTSGAGATAWNKHFANVSKGRRFAWAAVLVVVVGGGWLLREWIEPPPLWDQYKLHTLVEVYQHEIDTGLNPLWVCKNDHEFAGTFWRKVRQPLVMDEAPEHLQAIGLSYVHALSPDTTYLLARVRSRPVLVFVDRVEVDTHPEIEGGDLNLFRRQVDQLILYELTPLDEPHVLKLFRKPDVTIQWLEDAPLPTVTPAVGP